MLCKKGYTLIEIIIVIIIVSIIATLALSYYSNIKEDALDKQVKADLRLVRVAQLSYRMDHNGVYYPESGSTSVIGDINNNLKLLLATGGTQAWVFTVWSNGCSRATRNGADGRSWYLAVDDADEEPNAGAGCP
ncbi:MAG: prepilin-type N-terminal cleavage/methylation domain-containing protein [Candidatus Omnitrophota bacterium]